MEIAKNVERPFVRPAMVLQKDGWWVHTPWTFQQSTPTSVPKYVQWRIRVPGPELEDAAAE